MPPDSRLQGTWFHPDRLRLAPNAPCRLPYLLGLLGDSRLSAAELPDEIAAACCGESGLSPDLAVIEAALGPDGYRLVDERFALTDAGRRLHALRATGDTLYEEFARHILRKLDGLAVLDSIGRTAGGPVLPGVTGVRHQQQNDRAVHWRPTCAWLAEANLVDSHGVVWAAVH